MCTPRNKYFIHAKYNTFDFWSPFPIYKIKATCAISSLNCSYCLSNENTCAHSTSFLLSFDVQNQGGFRATKNVSFWILAPGPNPFKHCIKARRGQVGTFPGDFHKSIAFNSSPKRWVLRKKKGTKGWHKQPFLSLPCGFSPQVGRDIFLTF